MIFFKKHKCKPRFVKPLVVSGYGYTEYELNFCECGRVISTLTKDFDNLYPKLKGKPQC
jgi:hypothetical protein